MPVFRRFITLALLAAPWPAFAAERTTQVLIVGTYHMANPGRDLHNAQVDDVLTPRRQAEIAAVTTALARFEPNRVAVEWSAETTDERYAKFLAGTLPESRNEVVQLGFRLARERKLPRVYGVDVGGEFPYEAVQAWAKAHGRSGDLERMNQGIAAEVAKMTTLQSEKSIGGLLRYLNEPAMIARNHAFYPAMLTFGAGTEQPGVALVSAWTTRNLMICARLLQVIEPGDRVVVIFGQGHVYLLRQCLSEQPGFEVVSPLEYLPQ